MTLDREASRIAQVQGTPVVLDGNDIDTDRIIPARFMKQLTFDELGEHVFEDDRLQERERGSRHPFDQPERGGSSILLAGRNFGCGSSREHAAQALYRWGIRAIIAESFGEIFRGNCSTIGLPCLTLSASDLQRAREFGRATPNAPGEIDLETGVFRFGGQEYRPEISASLRMAFIRGEWDTLTMLMASIDDVAPVTDRLPYLQGFAPLAGPRTTSDR